MKLCKKCGNIKGLDEFHHSKCSKDGFDNKCKCCRNAMRRGDLKRRFNDWKYGAQRREILFGITFEDVNEMPKMCYYTGKKLTLESNRDTTLSLDRLDSNKGYIKNNIVFCCEYINTMKNDLGYNHFISVCKEIVDFATKKNENGN